MSSIDILVPDLPESVSDATVVAWHKKPGDFINREEVIVEIETDKVILEIPSSVNGVVQEIFEKEGATVVSRQILCRLEEVGRIDDNKKIISQPEGNAFTEKHHNFFLERNCDDITLTPSVRRLITENNLDADQIKGTGVGGRITCEDVEKYLAETLDDIKPSITSPILKQTITNRNEKRVLMTRLRKRVAERLLEVKNNTAILTTFNEVNMKPIMELRKQYGDIFEKRHGVRLGFMSFYIKAVVEALKRFPEVNASIDGDSIIYHNYFDVSIAVSTPRGLVTPVLKDADVLSMADIEKKIKELATKGREGKLTIEELTGGNFTITNGGIFGSLMSTPIINPPQSAILGMHAIKERPVVVNGQIVALPMMYLALSYDHCLIDGRESVSYLVSVKEMLEDPIRLLLDI